jgi:hypothetical protein
MLPTLRDKLVYILQFVLNGQPRSVALLPLDAANGVIIEETFEGSGVYWGRTVGGTRVEVPVASVTHIFASWWKVTENFSGNGYKTVHTNSDEWVEEHVTRKQDDPKAWDKDGVLKNVEGEETPPPDAKIIRR